MRVLVQTWTATNTLIRLLGSYDGKTYGLELVVTPSSSIKDAFAALKQRFERDLRSMGVTEFEYEEVQ